MQRTLTLILTDDGQVQVIPGGEWTLPEIVQACQATVQGVVAQMAQPTQSASEAKPSEE